MKEYYASPRIPQSFLKNMFKSLSKIHDYEKRGEFDFNLKQNDSIVTGNAVDCNITTPELFDEQFITLDRKLPSDSIVALFTYLLEYAKNELSIGYNLRAFTSTINGYLNNVEFEGFGKSRGTLEKALEKIYAEEWYWNFLVVSQNKTILDPQRLHTINHATNVLLTHRFTKELLEYKCINQVHLETDYRNIECKGLLDRILVNDTDKDHRFENGLIIPAHSMTIIDIKTGRYRPENLTKYMQEWRIDFQLAFYKMLGEANYPDYKFNNPLIVYTQNSSITNYPSVKQLSDKELNIARYGEIDGKENFMHIEANQIFDTFGFDQAIDIYEIFDTFGFDQAIDIYNIYLENGWDIDWKLIKSNGLCY